jgi:glycosyltransferase involved in cell wall biosynthesis
VSVIVPASGRPSIRMALRSIRKQNRGDIEIIVVTDGAQPAIERLCRRYPEIRVLQGPTTRRWGHAQRMVGIQRATGRYLMFLDDDDRYARGAFDAVRAAVRRDPDRIILFRMKWRHGKIWGRPELRLGNVGAGLVLVPNLPGKLGSWITNHRYESDFDFIEETVALQGEPVWNHRVVVICDAYMWWQVLRWPVVRWARRKAALRSRLAQARG